MTGLITFVVKNSASSPSLAQTTSNSAAVNVGGNNYGQVAGRDIINPTIIVPAPSSHEANSKWQPPELPVGCDHYFFKYGPKGFTVNLDQKTAGKSIFIPDLFPKELAQKLGPMPISVVYTNNRLYVRSINPISGLPICATPDEMDVNTDPTYDRNYNANAFEIINEQGVPTFQVIYEKPNSITVNAIAVLAAEINKPLALFVAFKNDYEIIPVTNRNDIANIETRYKSKTLFKYPSFQHLGEYAN